MKRVDVRMSDTFRGRVSDYASDTGKSMPEAYRDLMELGLGFVTLDARFIRDELIEELIEQIDHDESGESVITITVEDTDSGVEYTIAHRSESDDNIANGQNADGE